MRKATESKSAVDSVDFSVSTDQIRAVTKFLPIFDSIKPVDFSKSAGLPPGVVYGIGYVEFHPAVREFIDACYQNDFVQSFDWPAWGTQAKKYVDDASLVAAAKVEICIKLLTAHIRYERFCDGHLHSVFESGHLTESWSSHFPRPRCFEKSGPLEDYLGRVAGN